MSTNPTVDQEQASDNKPGLFGILPNRLAVYLTAGAALLGGLAPVVADLDWESTAGIIGGLATIGFIVQKWLDNWGKWERQEYVPPASPALPPPVVGAEQSFDEESAQPPTDHPDYPDKPVDWGSTRRRS